MYIAWDTLDEAQLLSLSARLHEFFGFVLWLIGRGS